MFRGAMISTALGLGLMTQTGRSGSSIPEEPRVSPVLAFPEPGLDDPSAYQGYRTRFYRDARGNTVQVYLDSTSARVVHLWADATDASAAFSVRNPAGQPVRLQWGSPDAAVTQRRGIRRLEYGLRIAAPRVTIGLFLLGSMRVERDFQYSRAHLGPFNLGPAAVVEESLLVDNVARLPRREQARHLKLLRTGTLDELRSRLAPGLVMIGDSVARIARPTLDGRHRLTLELQIDPRQATIRISGPSVVIEARNGLTLDLAVTIATDGAALTPLGRARIFNPAFLAFLERAGEARDSAGTLRYRRLEREVRGVELLASAQKLQAGLPNFATYFGRDMLTTALMMRPIWSAEMSEHVLASVLGKLSPAGEVSHEEALGGQAIREAAAEYNAAIGVYFELTGDGAAARDTLLRRARGLLGQLPRVRENYHMVDDEFQLPVLAARYLMDSTISKDRKRAFLLALNPGGESRLALLLRELALVTDRTADYAREPRVGHLVSFARRDSTHWRSSSWRDSDAGYGNGRYAMDINAIWAPEALAAIADIAVALPALGFSLSRLDSLASGPGGTLLATYLRDSAALNKAITTWRGARRHFLVTIGPARIAAHLSARLAAFSEEERRYWEKVMAPPSDSLTFLAIALDGDGQPIPIVNTDPATELFLRDITREMVPGRITTGWIEQGLAPVLRPYPAGLFVPRLGPVVTNDAYASSSVRERFEKDAYHGPRVVWGREVNLLLLGLASRIESAHDRSGRQREGIPPEYVDTLRGALRQIHEAVVASGLEHSELWSYRIEEGRLRPVRYGSGSDVQLWSSTDLAVQFLLDRLPAP